MKAVMGLEIHVHLLTKSKLFCSCSTEYEDKKPNSVTCPICLGFPGSKPKVNKKTIDLGIMVGKALNCKINSPTFFSRKSYFYPDMSKNFQITQYEIPLAKRGFLEIGEKKIRITRVHLEEDPAKLVHVGGDITSAKYVLIDYNRAGVPLIEIVTEPDFNSTKQVREFLSKLSSMLEHLGAFDPSREGSLRVDANISLEGGQRVEIKNITGFKNVEKALNYEIVRHKSLTKMGMKIERETRHFNAENNSTSSLRKKEFEEDYGYIFEPDLTKIEIWKKWVDELVQNMPELPDQRVARFVKEYKVSERQGKILVYVGKDLADFFEECCKMYKDYKKLARWVVADLLKCLNFQNVRISKSKVKPKTFVGLLTLIDDGKITERLAKEIIKEYVETGESPVSIVKKKGLTIMKGEELERVVKEVIKGNKKAVEDYKSGEEKALQFLLGQVLRKIKARADPNKIKRLIKKLI
jgi:aspartyl-tRNA(Asn)/glutamyl-tRNA(Gln) amidotransferase subunit B